MAAYVIVGVTEVTNPQQIEQYQAEASSTVEAYGGKFLAGGEIEKLDGDWSPFAGVVIEFPNKASVEVWYNSPEYQAVLPKRLNGSRSTLIVFDGG